MPNIREKTIDEANHGNALNHDTVFEDHLDSLNSTLTKIRRVRDFGTRRTVPKSKSQS
jgi:hypothetical protein